MAAFLDNLNFSIWSNLAMFHTMFSEGKQVAQWSKKLFPKLYGFKQFCYKKKAAVVLNFCLFGEIQYTFLVPRMIESGRQTFMPIQTLDLHRVYITGQQKETRKCQLQSLIFVFFTEICQLRLDFTNFDIVETTLGVCTDSLTIAGPTGRNPMDLCGTLTGMHGKYRGSSPYANFMSAIFRNFPDIFCLCIF